MNSRTKKLILTAATSLAALATLGSGTYLTMHAANDVSTVSQTAAPKTATADGTKLTATSTSGTKSNYKVTYTDQQGKQSATFQKQTLGTTSTATDEVDYVGQTDGANVKLTKNTTAVVQGTMGHTYVHWNTGKWSVTAVTDNADTSGTPTQFAKQVNSQLKQASLPDTAKTGSVTVYSGTESAKANTVKWQSGKQLYAVNGTTAADTVKLAQKSAD
ncbi:hypothetical protein LZY01_19280 [Levilactobacillus zymae]|uniref:Lipoprotein n=1 Tax=Levilactobacillus zymae TaxID=267363 RepID=A0ABQ0WXY5_9LACO|nr:hypothetical protein [Levilactobacillus zymae]KRL15038.1 hypothetical protein FD38_GL001085 [Levilactobacillus zymae DSM 19395]QFR61619.1 hypothetical protein LZ395_08840 [Levilactobacillus zymae]GEO72760.1 hypothetical protein LZY01_19280 [Levilactobacillus zymae]